MSLNAFNLKLHYIFISNKADGQRSAKGSIATMVIFNILLMVSFILSKHLVHCTSMLMTIKLTY